MPIERDDVIEAVQDARGTIAETARTVKDTAADLGSKAQQYATEAGRQANAAAQTLYGTGNHVLDIAEGFARENVWGSLLIAGVVGYGLACLVKNSR